MQLLKFLCFLLVAVCRAQPAAVKSVGVIINTAEDAVALVPIVESIRSKFSQDIKVFLIYCIDTENIVEQILRWYGLRSDATIILQHHSSAAQYLSNAINSFNYEFENLIPLEAIMVHGRSSLVSAATIAASANKISVIHVESGPIDNSDEDGLSDFALVTSLASLLIVPTESTRQALVRHGVANSRVKLTGSPVVSSMDKAVGEEPLAEEYQPNSPYIVLFFQFSEPDSPPPILTEVTKAILRLNGNIEFVYVFYNTKKTEELFNKLPARDNVIAMFNLGYSSVIRLLRGAVAALSADDSYILEAAYVGTRFLSVRLYSNTSECFIVFALID